MTSISHTAGASAGLLSKLQNIQIGGNGKKKVGKMKKRDLIFTLRNVSILIENGLSLTKALETLVKEKSLQKYLPMLQSIKSRVENGDAFSDALVQFPETFNELMVSQIRLGERSGTIPQTLTRL